MELIAADKNTVIIKMNWLDEFEVILMVFAALKKNYELADDQLHNVSKEEITAIQLGLEEIKQNFRQGKKSRFDSHKRMGLEVREADAQTVTLKISKTVDFPAILSVIGALLVRYDNSARETDPEIPGLTAKQLLMVEDRLDHILSLL